jgi:hypothetical protein
MQSIFGRKFSNVTNVSASSLNDEKWIHLKKDILYLKNINEWDHFCVEFKNNNIEQSISHKLQELLHENGRFIKFWRIIFSIFVVCIVYIYFLGKFSLNLRNDLDTAEDISSLPVFKVYILINLMYIIDLIITIAQYIVNFKKLPKFRKINGILLLIPFKILIAIPFPLELFYLVSLKFFRLDLINSLFNLIKERSYKIIDRFFHKHFVKVTLLYLNEIFKFLLMFILYSHFMTCLTISIDIGEASLDQEHYDYESFYIKNLYATFSTFTNVGYGDIVASKPITCLIYMINMFFGYDLFIITTYYVKMLFQKIKFLKKQKRNAKKNFEDFIYHLQKNVGRPFPIKTKNSMWSYLILKNAMSFPRIFESYKYLKNCRPDIRKEISIGVFDFLIKEYAVFFKGCSQQFMIKIFSKLKPKIFKPGKIIINNKNRVEKLIFLLNGGVEILNKNGKKIFNIYTSSILGDFQFLTNCFSELIYKVDQKNFALGFLLDIQDYLKISEEFVECSKQFGLLAIFKQQFYTEMEFLNEEVESTNTPVFFIETEENISNENFNDSHLVRPFYKSFSNEQIEIEKLKSRPRNITNTFIKIPSNENMHPELRKMIEDSNEHNLLTDYFENKLNYFKTKIINFQKATFKIKMQITEKINFLQANILKISGMLAKKN